MPELTGIWQIAPDPQNVGRTDAWFLAVRPEALDIPVPGEIHLVYPDQFGVFWYWRCFASPPSDAGARALLRFGAVDYFAEVWVNGVFIGSHEGGETGFTFDITAALRPGGDNLLAVRVINPGDTRVDDFLLVEIPHRNKTVQLLPGSSYNYGGILLPVELETVPAVRISEIFVEPDPATGVTQVHFTVCNANEISHKATARVVLGPARSDEIAAAADMTVVCPPGESSHTLSLIVSHPHRWNLDDPFLYRVEVSLHGVSGEHRSRVRFGFRDFRVENGWFMLNGKRIFLKSTHTGNHFPLTWVAPMLPDFQRRDLIYAKALGFNCVRFISGVGWPEQLDFCDEIGLMVYEEHLAGWCLGESPQMPARFDRATREMVRRDRNHPCITIWGLLNETVDGPVFLHAVATLPLVRELDPTRLVLLQSGRWDGQPSIGSVSNPGSATWEHHWGVEAPDAPSTTWGWSGGYFENAGDAHVYPTTPQTAETNAGIRNLGHDQQPVFLSEYGIGSLMNVIDERRKYGEAHTYLAAPDSVTPAQITACPEVVLLTSMVEKLEADWRRYGFEDVYAFPEDMLRDSQRLHARQRRLGFDLIRSNPQICGYNLTGMLDHAITGEGVWTFWRELKPGIAEVLRDGWAPLRWCLFVTPLHAYAGQSVTVEAVLANEDVLPPGEYPVTFRIQGPDGPAWERQATVRIPHPAPGGKPLLAVPVLKEEIVLDGPAGGYELAARLHAGGCPAGDRMSFRLSSAQNLPSLNATVTVWGLEARAIEWLEAHGVACRPWDGSTDRQSGVIVVGLPDGATAAEWTALQEAIAGGCTALFLQPRAFAAGDDSTYWLPLETKGICKSFYDWLYHKDCVAKRHPVFDGLQAGGILDWDFYDQLISHELFEGQETPDEVIVAAFAAGYCCPGGYESGVMVGRYRYGTGHLILNTLHVLEQLARHPAADRLLLNFLRYALELAGDEVL